MKNKITIFLVVTSICMALAISVHVQKKPVNYQKLALQKFEHPRYVSHENYTVYELLGAK